jgi:clathrin heavy chain
MELMEQGLGLEGAHAGIFTELGVLYSRYAPSKLMEHIKIFWSRMNIPKMLRACEQGRHWKEACFLHVENQEYDAAVKCMIEHAESAWEHNKFMDCCTKCRNTELHYRAISFYLEDAPMKLEKLLSVLTPQLDHARVVQLIRKTDNLPLIVPYLKSVQSENISAVNEAYNEILVDEEDCENLRISIDEHENFDQIGLAQKIEKHELLELRRIAAYLYKKNRRFQESVALSKIDKMYKDCIDTAAESRDQDIAEGLLGYFVEEGDKECFAATLYTCYDLVRPDVVMEISWRNNLNNFAMPYMIQYMRESHEKIKMLEERTKVKEEEEDEEADSNQYMTDGLGNPYMLANSAYNGAMPQQNGYGMHMQQPQMGMNNMGMGMGMQQQMYGGGMNTGY